MKNYLQGYNKHSTWNKRVCANINASRVRNKNEIRFTIETIQNDSDTRTGALRFIYCASETPFNADGFTSDLILITVATIADEGLPPHTRIKPCMRNDIFVVPSQNIGKVYINTKLLSFYRSKIKPFLDDNINIFRLFIICDNKIY